MAREIIERILKLEYVIIGYPRLVRLNPNIPWKTRGNGALAFQVEKTGTPTKIIGGTKNVDYCIATNYQERMEKSDINPIKIIIQDVLNKYAQIDGPNTNPGAVILDKQPPINIYHQAVKNLFTIKEIKAFLDHVNCEIISYKNARGLIGATAATAWRPNKNLTFELITYRNKKVWGTPRKIFEETVKQIDKAFPSTFDNYDYHNVHNRIAPNSPCPILYGIRGMLPDDLIEAMKTINSEPIASWLIFQSNQGSDDHLQKISIMNVKPFQSVIIKGTVIEQPYTIKGGHVIFSIKDNTGRIDVAAYEPTKEFRNIIRQLKINDSVRVYGGVRKKPLTVNLEKIQIKKLETKPTKLENPVCQTCGKHMKSIGKNQGFRCRKCRTSEKNPIYQNIKRTIETGWYESPVCARRHLAKPLKLKNNNL